MLLEGKVGYVIGNFRRLLKQHRLIGNKRKTLSAVITYYENNRDQMKYDEYLAAGYPIGSGVAEGACRYLVKDRMERAGPCKAPNPCCDYVRSIPTDNGPNISNTIFKPSNPGYIGKLRRRGMRVTPSSKSPQMGNYRGLARESPEDCRNYNN